MQNNSHSFFIYVVLILSIAAAVAAGYFAGRNKTMMTAPAVIPATNIAETPSPSAANSILLEPLQETSPTPPSSSPAPTSAIKTKTFKNSRYQFEYPAEWKITDDSYATLLFVSAEDMGGPGYKVSISESGKKYLKIGFADPVGTEAEVGDKILQTKTGNTTISGVPSITTKTAVGAGSATDAVPSLSAILDLSSQGKPDKVLLISITGLDAETQTQLDVITKHFKLL